MSPGAGPRLRDLRRAHGLTQRQLAERLGLSTNYLAQLEREEKPMQIAVWVAAQCELKHKAL